MLKAFNDVYTAYVGMTEALAKETVNARRTKEAVKAYGKANDNLRNALPILSEEVEFVIRDLQNARAYRCFLKDTSVCIDSVDDNIEVLKKHKETIDKWIEAEKDFDYFLDSQAAKESFRAAESFYKTIGKLNQVYDKAKKSCN